MSDAALSDDARTLAAVRRALRLATIALPHLAGLAHSVRISIDARVLAFTAALSVTIVLLMMRVRCERSV